MRYIFCVFGGCANRMGMEKEREEKTNVLGRVCRELTFRRSRLAATQTKGAQLVKCARTQGLMSATQSPLHFQSIFGILCGQNAKCYGDEGRTQPKWNCFFQKKNRSHKSFSPRSSLAIPAEMIAFCGWSASKMMWGLFIASEACHLGAFSRLRRLGLRSPKLLWAKCGAPRTQSQQRLKTLPKRWFANRKLFLPFTFLYPHKTFKKKEGSHCREVYYSGLKETHISLSLSRSLR